MSHRCQVPRYKEGPGRANRVGGGRVEVGQQAGSRPMVQSIGNRLPKACSNKSARVVPTAPVQVSGPATGAVGAVAGQRYCNSSARFESGGPFVS